MGVDKAGGSGLRFVHFQDSWVFSVVGGTLLPENPEERETHLPFFPAFPMATEGWAGADGGRLGYWAYLRVLGFNDIGSVCVCVC